MRFVATAIAEEDIIDWIRQLNVSELTIGSHRSRGYGLARLGVLGEKMPIEKYIDGRAVAIEKGFERITEVTEGLWEKEEEAVLGTATGLSPLSLDSDMDHYKAAASRLSLARENIAFLAGKRGTHLRYEFQGSDFGGPSFTFTSVLNPGYAAVFSSTAEVEELSRHLAEAEVVCTDCEPWFGWIYVNHPIHFTGTTLQGKGGG